MRVRIMLHYAGSFFLACLFIVVINVFYMRSYVYREGSLYHFDPSEAVSKISQDIQPEEKEGLAISPALAEYLESESIGMQLIDEQFNAVVQYNAPEVAKASYAPDELVGLYEEDSVTTFVEAVTVGGSEYTALLFYSPDRVKRTLYAYDVVEVGAAYNVYWLMGMNLVLLLMISYIYTYSISRPIHRMTERVVALAQGDYDTRELGSGIYATVESAMNRLSKQLAEADATREEWISNLSHDIKTPLTSMMGYGELLGEDLSWDEREHYKEVILEKGAYIETLLSDLNLTTRLKHGDHFLKLSPVLLVKEMKGILIDILNSPQLVEQAHQLSLTYAAEDIVVDLDQRLFKRVLVNLVSNSFVHNEKPISVNVHIKPLDDQWVCIEVDDDGVGVSEEELEHVFTRYYRGTHTRTKSEGSGLGMAIAKDIINAHKGRIRAEKSPRGGLKTTIELRRALSHEALS